MNPIRHSKRLLALDLKLYAGLLLLLFLAQPLNAQPAGKKILLEKFTSAGCPGCPWGGYILDSLAQADPNIIPVAIHLHDQWHVDRMAFPEGDTLIAHYRWAQPTVMVDRIKFSDQQNIALINPFWKPKIDERKLDPVAVSIGANSTYDANSRQLDVTVLGEVLDGMTGDVRVNAYVVESPVSGTGLGWDQLNGYDNNVGHPLYGLGNPITNYQHKWVCRDMLGGPWGQTGVIPNPAPANTLFSHTFTTTLDTAWNDINCYLVVLVQRYNSDENLRTIVNAAQLGLNENLVTDIELSPIFPQTPTIVAYPNPSEEVIYIRNDFPEATIWRLYDVNGKVHRQGAVNRSPLLRIEQGDMSPGIYLFQLQFPDDRQAHLKLIFR